MFEFLKKKPHTAVIQPDGTELVVKPGEKLLTAALEAGLPWPHDCRVGSCGSCRCILKSGKTKSLTDFSYTLDMADLNAGAILACQTQLKSDIEVEVVLGSAADIAALEHHDARIVETTPRTHDILEVLVETEAACFENAKAGQYAELGIEGVAAPRSYSFAAAPRLENARHARFFIRHVPGGEFTDWLFETDRTGSALRLAGPFGDFYRRAGSGAMICVAGGSGLAPIKAILEEARHDGIERDVRLYFGARTQADLYSLDALEDLAAHSAGQFEFIPVLSHENADSDWSGRRGFVTEALAEDLEAVAPSFGSEAYLCGPPPMIDAAIEVLTGTGLGSDVIFFDKFLDASSMPGGRSA